MGNTQWHIGIVCTLLFTAPNRSLETEMHDIDMKITSAYHSWDSANKLRLRATCELDRKKELKAIKPSIETIRNEQESVSIRDSSRERIKIN